ncbi:hypothetical protein M0P98_04900 [bacterium]|nr:hypothetical protein [bacterium]
MYDTKYWSRIKKFGYFSMFPPFLLFFLGIYLEKHNFIGLVEGYDIGMARIAQYILFGIGVLIVFFNDGISEFFASRLFVQNDDSRLDENKSSYFAYIFIMLFLLNMISILGFIGYIICSNISWLVLFVILNISLQMKYLPSVKRFEKLIQSIKK